MPPLFPIQRYAKIEMNSELTAKSRPPRERGPLRRPLVLRRLAAAAAAGCHADGKGEARAAAHRRAQHADARGRLSGRPATDGPNFCGTSGAGVAVGLTSGDHIGRAGSRMHIGVRAGPLIHFAAAERSAGIATFRDGARVL